MLEVQLLLRHGLGRDDMSRDMTLEDVGDTEFELVGVLSRERVGVVTVGLGHCFGGQLGCW